MSPEGREAPSSAALLSFELQARHAFHTKGVQTSLFGEKRRKMSSSGFSSREPCLPKRAQRSAERAQRSTRRGQRVPELGQRLCLFTNRLAAAGTASPPPLSSLAQGWDSGAAFQTRCRLSTGWLAPATRAAAPFASPRSQALCFRRETSIISGRRLGAQLCAWPEAGRQPLLPYSSKREMGRKENSPRPLTTTPAKHAKS